jgi:hypothetical protein
MNVRAILRGNEQSPARYGAHAIHGAGSNFSPAINPAFPRGNFAQALIDVFAIGFGMLFIFSGAVSVVGAIFILLFVEVH